MTRRIDLHIEALEDRSTPSVSPAGSLRGDPSDYDDKRILVRFRPDAGELTRWHAPSATTIGRELPLVPGLHEVRLAPGIDVETALASFRGNPLVEYAQPNYRLHAQLTPNDPGFESLWGLDNNGQTGGTPDADIDAPEAWDTFTGNGSTIVAVIDTGIDYNHPDLAGNMWTNPGEDYDGNGVDDDGNGIVDDYYGANFIYRDEFGAPTGDPFDDFFHGTHVAGTIGAVGNNDVGVTGVSWNVQIMAIKFLDSYGSGWTSDAIDGLNYAVSKGAMISNNSWGGGPYDQGLYDAIQSAGAQGHLFVAAAGNWGVDADFDPMYPAAYDLDNIVSVAATDHNDQLAYFSNYGAMSVDLGAPGVDVYSTFPTYETQAMFDYGLPIDYGTISGTSMAAPHVAGVAALIRDQHPTWSAQEVKDQLLGTVDPIAALDGITVTGGRLNAAAAVTGTITPRLTIHDVTVTEGNSGTRAAVFDVTLSAPSTEPVTVNYTTSNGTATAGSDYQAKSGTLTFAPGETSLPVIVLVAGDRLGEANETFVVNLSGGTNALIGDGRGMATIVDDEPRVSIDNFSKVEGKNNQTTQFTFTVTLPTYDQAVSMTYRTVNGTATSGSDYTAKTGTLTFALGESTKTIMIAVKGDKKKEPNEYFYVDLTGTSNNFLFTKSRGVGTILNDD